MKYINALETKYELSLFFLCEKEEGESVTLEEIVQVIDRMDSVDVRENIHGEWEMVEFFDDEYEYRCSNCMSQYDMPTKTNFCPHCGADMRERKETE